jgi:hypothetical protein
MINSNKINPTTNSLGKQISNVLGKITDVVKSKATQENNEVPKTHSAGNVTETDNLPKI